MASPKQIQPKHSQVTFSLKSFLSGTSEGHAEVYGISSLKYYNYVKLDACLNRLIGPNNKIEMFYNGERLHSYKMGILVQMTMKNWS